MAAGLLKATQADSIKVTITQYKLSELLQKIVTARRLILSEITIGLLVLISTVSGLTQAVTIVSYVAMMIYLIFAVATARVLWMGETLSCNCFGVGHRSTYIGYFHAIRSLGFAISVLVGVLLYKADLSVNIPAALAALIFVIVTLTGSDIYYLQSANKSPFATATTRTVT